MIRPARPETLCREVGSRLSALLDRELTPLEAAGAEAHLAACPACSRELETLLELSEAVRTTGRQVPQPPPWSGVEARLTRGRARRQAWWVTLAASLLFAFIAGSLWLNRQTATPSRSGAAPLPPREVLAAGLPGFDRFLTQHRARELPPDQLSNRLSFRPHLPRELPGGFRLERAFLIEDRCCAGTCLLFRRGEEAMALVQQPPSHPLLWRGARLREEKLSGTACRRGRIADVELIQIDPTGANLTLVTRTGSVEPERLVEFLAGTRSTKEKP